MQIKGQTMVFDTKSQLTTEELRLFMILSLERFPHFSFALGHDVAYFSDVLQVA